MTVNSLHGSLVLLLVAAGLVAGCGNDGRGEQAPAFPPSLLETEEPLVGCPFDYQPMRGPRQMARESDLVVRGTIGRPRAGLVAVRPNGGTGRVETDIIPIEVSSVLRNGERLGGSRSGRPDPTYVDVEISCPFPPPDRAEKLASLAGRQAIAYLVDGPEDIVSSYPGHVKYMSAPPSPRFQEASVEGLIVELSSGEGVRNLSLGMEFPTADLTDFYPSRPKFPPSREP